MRHSLATLAVLLTAAPALGQRAPYSAEQLSLIRAVDECQLAPDGRTVAFVSDITGALELWTVPAAGGWPSQLTNLGEHVTDVRWSPDGRWLVFASDYGGNERRDLYRVPAAGGAVEKLTDTRLSESQPRWSPDGRQLAYLADPDRDFDFQLHVLDVQTQKSRRLTREPVKVQGLVWSPDGKAIAVNRSGDDQKGDLLLVDVATGARTVVGPLVKDGNVLPAAFAPDGKALLVLALNEAGFEQLAVLDLDPAGEPGKPPRPRGKPAFVGPGDWDVTEARWNKAGIYFLRNEGSAVSLNLLPTPAGRPVILLPARASLRNFSLDHAGNRLALLQEDVTHPADVWIGDIPKDADGPMRLRQVTFSLLGGVKPEELSTGEMVRYESFDRRTIHALFIKPRVHRLGTPPPAVVFVHGGPDGQQMVEFDPYLQLLAEEGFAVISPNFRGSTGYGRAFQDANNKDWGGGDLKDLTAAVRHFAARGAIDPKRVGITGGSFGGYLTLMALCRTPEVWMAGVECYGMPDLVMDYLLSKSRFADWYETEMGNPKHDAARFRERSPLPYLDDIRAPLLVFQGANDSNVPRAESDLLVAVLKELKKPHEYIVYDDEGHGFTRRKNLLDFYKRSSAFFVKEARARK
jgi:dipeptidyl aminopeptidase/acylaminoacyl peptidase